MKKSLWKLFDVYAKLEFPFEKNWPFWQWQCSTMYFKLFKTWLLHLYFEFESEPAGSNTYVLVYFNPKHMNKGYVSKFVRWIRWTMLLLVTMRVNRWAWPFCFILFLKTKYVLYALFWFCDKCDKMSVKCHVSAISHVHWQCFLCVLKFIFTCLCRHTHR